MREEDTRVAAQWAPLRAAADAEAVELDPERAVGLDEIEPALVRLVLPRSRAALVKVLLRALRVAVPARAASAHACALRRAYAAEDACLPAGLASGGWAAALAPPAPPARRAAPVSCVELDGAGAGGEASEAGPGACADLGAALLLAAAGGWTAMGGTRREEWNTGAPDEGGAAAGAGGGAGAGADARGFRERAVALLLARFAGATGPPRSRPPPRVPRRGGA